MEFNSNTVTGIFALISLVVGAITYWKTNAGKTDLEKLKYLLDNVVPNAIDTVDKLFGHEKPKDMSKLNWDVERKAKAMEIVHQSAQQLGIHVDPQVVADAIEGRLYSRPKQLKVSLDSLQPYSPSAGLQGWSGSELKPILPPDALDGKSISDDPPTWSNSTKTSD